MVLSLVFYLKSYHETLFFERSKPGGKSVDIVSTIKQVQIAFTGIGELTGGYYIESCTADNKLDAQIANSDGTTRPNYDYKSVNLISSGCKVDSGDNIGAINPQIVNSDGQEQTGGGTILEFNQFAFVTARKW